MCVAAISQDFSPIEVCWMRIWVGKKKTEVQFLHQKLLNKLFFGHSYERHSKQWVKIKKILDISESPAVHDYVIAWLFVCTAVVSNLSVQYAFLPCTGWWGTFPAGTRHSRRLWGCIYPDIPEHTSLAALGTAACFVSSYEWPLQSPAEHHTCRY